MKLKLIKIVNDYESLIELAKVKMPIKISYNISKLIKRVEPEIDIHVNKRNGLLKEYGTESKENPNQYTISPDKIAKFNEAVKELNEIEIDIEVEKIKIEALGDINIEPRLLIDWLFE